MRELPDLGAARLGVVSRAEAVAAGWSVDALNRAVRSGRIERVRRGDFAPPVDPGLHPAEAAIVRLARTSIAASVSNQRRVVSHLAAARVHGWPVWADRARPCVSAFDRGRTTRLTGVHLHPVAFRPGTFVRASGVSVTGPARTVVDVAREFGVEAGLVVADAALRCAAVSRADVHAACLAAAGEPGIGAARFVADRADGRSESPLESRSRWHVELAGLPAPTPQVVCRTPGGRFIGRVDLWWDGVVGEVDGLQKYVDRDVLRAEKQRQEALEAAGLVVVRWGARELADFRPTAERIRRALALVAA